MYLAEGMLTCSCSAGSAAGLLTEEPCTARCASGSSLQAYSDMGADGLRWGVLRLDGGQRKVLLLLRGIPVERLR